MAQFRTIWLTLTCLALATPTFVAAEPAEIFQIELLVFARTDETVASQERWPLDPGIPSWANSAELTGPVDPEAPNIPNEGTHFERLPATVFALSDAAQRLRQSRDYRVLLHTAWRQSIPNQSSGTPVFIDDSTGPQSLPRITKEIQLVGTPQVAAGKPSQPTKPDDMNNGVIEPEAEAPVAPPPPRFFAEGPPNLTVFGTLAIRQTRFLHAVLDLLYRAPQKGIATAAAEAAPKLPAGLTLNEARASGNSPIRAFRLTETRRLRTGDIHYFDHPMFGAMLRVTPVVSQAEPAQSETPAQKPVPTKKAPKAQSNGKKP